MRRSIIAIAALLACAANASAQVPEDHSWHLLTQSYGGSISLIKGLTKHECEVAHDRALRIDEMNAELARNDVPCPKDDSKEGWAAWQKAHWGATGCRTPDGGSVGWGLHQVSNGDIKSAECFQ